MLHTFIDTNVFLSLFAFTDDNIEELRKISSLVEKGQLKLYLSSVVNQEFNRNRDRKVEESFGNLEKFTTNLSIPRFMEHHEEAVEVRRLLKEVGALKSCLLEKAKSEIRSCTLAADLLFDEVKRVAGLQGISDECDEKARRRLERGNPPGKAGDIGDRLNWEFLLEKVPTGQDLHLVSRDKDYSSPFGKDIPNSYLRGEWKAVKAGELYLYGSLKAFVDAKFPEIKIAADVAKVLAIRALIAAQTIDSMRDAIANVSPVLPSLSADEARQIFLALIDKDDASTLAKDSDIRSFYESMLIDHWAVLEQNEYRTVTDLVPDPIPF